jgi:peptidoglycan/LPS O-acetylase OafA/YrhL
VTAAITAGAGFLLAVLWFDLMHDVQVRGRAGGGVPEEALASIAGYYRRVTTDARPMNRLVALAMLATLASIVVSIAQGNDPRWVGWASLALVGLAVAVAAGHTVAAAVRLGGRSDPPDVQTRLARSIYRDHLICLVAVAATLVVQLGFG